MITDDISLHGVKIRIDHDISVECLQSTDIDDDKQQHWLGLEAITVG